jgi:hypothetical protein
MPLPNLRGCGRPDGRDDEHLVFVRQPGRDGLGGEPPAADCEVTAGRFLQLADLARVEVLREGIG